MNEDSKQLQGVWSIVSLEMDGHSSSGAALDSAKISIQGKRFISTGMGAAYEGTIELDPTSTPKAFALNFTTGPEKGNSNLGIYELEGDTWRICLATRGTNRPQRFAAPPGTGIALEVLKRNQTTVDEQPAPAAFDLANVSFEPASELAGEWSMVSGIVDGKALPSGFVKSAKRVVQGNDTMVTFGREVYAKAKYTVDRSKTPAAIDLYNSEGMNAGKVQYGIYEVTGTTLRLSIAAPGRERPDNFGSAKGDCRTVVVWTRT